MDAKTAVGLAVAVTLAAFAGEVVGAQTGPGPRRVDATSGYGCAGVGIGSWMIGPFNTAQITQERAKDIAQRYADSYLKGFTVVTMSAVSGMTGMTTYAVDLKGPHDEVRTIHVNAWGIVIPAGGLWWRDD